MDYDKPSKKEEIYGVLYEFDDQARAMADYLIRADKTEMTSGEQALLDAYAISLLGLILAYDELDRYTGHQMQNGGP